jgi:uncharacterized protein
MLDAIVMALGLVLVIEGLLYAAVPGHLRRMAEAMRALSDEQMRLVGLSALGIGVLLVWVARVFLQG